MSASIHSLEPRVLADLEKVIADGLRTFVDVGSALARIRDEQLYKAQHKTFEAYCRERWNLSRQRAYELVTASTVAENVRRAGHGQAPNARQATELAKLPEKDQGKAWAQAIETAPHGVVTAKHVANVVAERMPKKKAAPIVHECPRHGCKYDDGAECPVCADRKKKGLDDAPSEDRDMNETAEPDLHVVVDPPKPLTEKAQRAADLDQRIGELLTSGKQVYEVAEELGVHRTRVQKAKSRLGLVKKEHPLRGLVASALDGTDTWQDALRDTEELWSQATPDEVDDLATKLEALAFSARSMARALKRHAAGRRSNE